MTRKVGIALPHEPGHKVRGVGFYTQALVDHLHKYASDYNIELISFSGTPPGGLDLVHYPYFDIFKPSLPLFKRSRTIVSILDTTPLMFPDHFPLGFRSGLALTSQRLSLLMNVVHIITISEFSKSQIPKYFPVKSHDISVTLLSARSIFKPQGDVNISLKLPKRFVLYVGDVDWSKNLYRLTQACVNSHIHLVIVGKSAVNEDQDFSHPELKHFKLWLSEFANHPLIHRLGFVSDNDLVKLYNLAACYVQPSLSEGFGLPLLEAMACGTPCASSNTTSLPEVGGDSVVYFNPGNVAEISETLEKILGNPKLASDLSKRGIARASLFSWDKTAKSTLETYNQFL